jgi:hypothetical protein
VRAGQSEDSELDRPGKAFGANLGDCHPEHRHGFASAWPVRGNITRQIPSTDTTASIALPSTFSSSPIQPLLGNSSTVTTMRKAFDNTLTKLKPPAPLQAKDGALRRIPRSTAFIALQKALELFQEVAGTTGVPGLQVGVKGLTILLNAIQVRLSHHSFPSSCSWMDPPS